MAKTPPDKSKDDGSARPPKTSKTGAREPAAMGQSVPTPKRSPSSKTPLANNVKRTLRTKADTAPATGIEKADRSQKKVRDLASGGGDRVAAGVNFHASICAALAVWMLTGRSVDHRLELGDAQIVTLRAESESPLDDVLAQTSAGGVIAVQAKSSLSFGKELSSEFGKTIEQIVRQWRLCRNGKGDLGWNRPLDAATDRLVIAVGPESPATMRVDLKEGLDARRQPGPPVLTKATKAALDKFDACVRLAWESMEPSEALTEDRLLAISRLTHVYVSDPQGLERAALETVLGTALAAPADATSALEVLEKRSEHLMEKRGGWDLAKLRADLLTRGVKLAARPDYRSDIAALKECSMRTAEALLEFEVVTPEVGVSVGIKRECQDAVDAAALEGDLLLIGEPGAGKSAMLNSLGRTLRERGHDVVQLAVDRYPIASLEGLSHALQLQHDLLAVLEQWDGAGPAFLLIDALDASRGGSAESVFKSVVEGVVKRHGRWTVVASIRTFDLRMGQSFPALFEGTPPVDELKGVGLPRVRHVQIPAWSPTEFAQLLAKSPRLAEVLSDAPWKLRELAMVPFNLRLLAELIANGAVSESFQQVKSQIELLNLYWKWRVEPFGTPGQICLKAVLAEMIIRRAIYARRLAVAAPDAAILDNLEKQGVLIAKDRDTIRFRHHLLFDYAASRVFLDADAIIAGDTVFRKSEGAGLILAPAVSFLLQDLWSEHPQRARFWAAVKQLLGIGDCDPVIRSVTARAAAELPAEASDMMLFGRGIEDGDPVALSALPHIVGAVAVRLDDHAETPLAPWVALAAAISRNPEPVAVILRVMIFHLVSRAKEPTIRAELGTAARALLNYSLTLPDPRGLTAAAITFVCETMASNVDASVALLDRLLTDARFDAFGPEEYPALARKIDVIYPLAPAFAVKIYADVYAREIREDRATRMGDSQILRLTSNAKQDFEMARWTLNEHYPSFLASLPVEGTAALLAALDGYLARDKRSKGGLPEFTVTLPAGDTVTVREDRSYVWAHEERPGSTQDADALLAGFLTFLKTGDEQGMLAAARYALRHASLGAVWSRLFLAAAARGGPLSDLVGLYAFQFGFLVGSDTRKGAVDVVASRYDRLSKGERVAFENQAAEANFEAFAFPVEAKQRLLSRLFATIGSDRLATRAAKKVVATTSASAETNPPLFSVTTETLPGDAYYWMNDTTRSAPDVLALTEAVDCVRKKLRLAPNDDDPLALSIDEALQTLRHLKEQIDAGRVSDETLMRQADGFFAEGVQKLVRSDLVGPDTEPDHVGLLADWIEMACTSTNPQTYPDTEAKFEKFTSWGSPSARLSGAEAALDLIWKRPETRPRLMPTADRMLADPHPAIRMHAADRLVRIWDLDREGFWQRAAQIVTSEQNRGVLNAFSTQTLGRLVGHGVAGEVAALVLPLLDRLDVKDERNDEIRRHLVQLTILLWQNFRIDEAAVRVRAWVAAPTDHVDEVCEIIKWLRADYVSGLRGPVDPQRPDRRAIASGVMSEAVEGATDELASHHDDFGDLAPVPLKRAQNAVQIVNEACQQLFFASGAFRQANQDESQPPMSVEDARTFFRETRATLERIAQHGETNTLYYLLQILEFLVDVHPSGVFDLVARTIRRGQRGGLAFEGLAADIAVNLVARYLADHREVFDDPDRRAALIDALEIFSTAGWPAALRLFYRLPELLE